MITAQHHYASRILNPQHRHNYRLHMCGLCHALGDNYGLLSRWLTSYDLILLNLLTSAQEPEKPVEVMRRCPLNPFRQVRTNQDTASTFAAHIAVNLAGISVADDVQDSGDLKARVLHSLLKRPQKRAITALEKLGFDTETLRHLSQAQSQAESDSEIDPSAPTALVSAAIFGMTAQLAEQPQNEAPLEIIGANYGAYLYLMDAYRDFPRDWVNGDFNPLRPYAETDGDQFKLSVEGLNWLKGRFEAILATIESELANVNFQRSARQIRDMLTDPIRRALRSLKTPVHYQSWQPADALKAGLFLLPLTATFEAGQNELPDVPIDEEQIRQEKSFIGLAECAYCSCADCDGEDACDMTWCGLEACGVFQDVDCNGCDVGDCDAGGCDGCDAGGCDAGGADCNCN